MICIRPYLTHFHSKAGPTWLRPSYWQLDSSFWPLQAMTQVRSAAQLGFRMHLARGSLGCDHNLAVLSSQKAAIGISRLSQVTDICSAGMVPPWPSSRPLSRLAVAPAGSLPSTWKPPKPRVGWIPCQASPVEEWDQWFRYCSFDHSQIWMFCKLLGILLVTTNGKRGFLAALAQ